MPQGSGSGPEQPRVVALVGPTGAGKSAHAIAAARAVGAVVVAVDAFTVYRGMDIGTATPSPADRAQVPHRMVDVLEVEQECTVRWFQATARAAIDAVREAGSPVLLVGGSGLYFRAVVDPLEFPPTDAGVRAVIERQVADDPAAGHARLASMDPDAAARIEAGNVRRTTRALEVIELTGRRFSDFRTAWDAHRSIYGDVTVLGVDHEPEVLRQRIAARTDVMLAAGWVGEVAALADRSLSSTAAQAIGYAELAEHLRGGADLASTRERIIMRTRRFAARQRRWFRGDPRVEWTAAHDVEDRLVAALRAPATRSGE